MDKNTKIAVVALGCLFFVFIVITIVALMTPNKPPEDGPTDYLVVLALTGSTLDERVRAAYDLADSKLKSATPNCRKVLEETKDSEVKGPMLDHLKAHKDEESLPLIFKILDPPTKDNDEVLQKANLAANAIIGMVYFYPMGDRVDPERRTIMKDMRGDYANLLKNRERQKQLDAGEGK